jgi:MOSC domain-containing protein YiiM
LWSRPALDAKLMLAEAFASPAALGLRWTRPLSTRNDRTMQVEAINIGPSDAIAPVQAASVLAGKGLQGDRHFYQEGAAPGEALTLIEAEVLESVGLTGAQSRRQVVVRGVRLNDLVGRRFRVGEVECLGVELCEPCLHLQQLTRPGIIKELIHRAGLNADILNDGRISVGDAIVVHGQP